MELILTGDLGLKPQEIAQRKVNESDAFITNNFRRDRVVCAVDHNHK